MAYTTNYPAYSWLSIPTVIGNGAVHYLAYILTITKNRMSIDLLANKSRFEPHNKRLPFGAEIYQKRLVARVASF